MYIGLSFWVALSVFIKCHLPPNSEKALARAYKIKQSQRTKLWGGTFSLPRHFVRENGPAISFDRFPICAHFIRSASRASALRKFSGNENRMAGFTGPSSTFCTVASSRLAQGFASYTWIHVLAKSGVWIFSDMPEQRENIPLGEVRKFILFCDLFNHLLQGFHRATMRKSLSF